MSERDNLVEDLVDWAQNRFFGKYRGLVEENTDSTKRGRLLVSVPAVLGDAKVWAMPCVPYAGAAVGMYMLPEAQTGVWVEFEAGDISCPIWTGFFWADNEIPDKPEAAIKVIKTLNTTIRIDDDKKTIQIKSGKGGEVTIDASVLSKAGNGEHKVSDGSVTSQSGGTGSVDVSQASVSVNSGSLEVT